MILSKNKYTKNLCLRGITLNDTARDICCRGDRKTFKILKYFFEKRFHKLLKPNNMFK